ncbi:hypothetical protein LMG28727_04880 [Paraburkholderia kirstenboschensis]|uniref:hypothetical protein n=1 Tax=Paraburkholderia kirstenboschensis TaxID=1245436 RepID=UPI000A850142|nr:hypothetical protein [Paraburkholderia kirstenboschensis]CAD6548714.1 hypothetical protein LMG28727_04880 [Paraburkholderia kirstenboschensis]
MSDPIAEAASLNDAAPSSTEPQQIAPDVPAEPAVSQTPAVLQVAVEAGNADAGTSPAGAAKPAVTGNVLLNASPVIDAPVLAEPVAEAESEPLPRESHLMLLAHKLAAMHSKLKNGERIVIDEFEQILGHIQAVL